MGISIAIVSGKGGVGKSTLCANLGVALSQMGKKTLVIDGDLEGASQNLLFGMDFHVPTLHQYLSGEVGAEDTVFTLPEDGGPDIVVGSMRVESLKTVKFELFQKLISELSGYYDILLVDAPAGLGIDVFNVVSACDCVIVMTNPDVLSVAGALKAKVLAERLEKKILGMVVNKAGRRYDIPSDYMEEMVGIDIIGIIEEDDAVHKALVAGKPLILESPDSRAAKSIRGIAKVLVGEDG